MSLHILSANGNTTLQILYVIWKNKSTLLTVCFGDRSFDFWNQKPPYVIISSSEEICFQFYPLTPFFSIAMHNPVFQGFALTFQRLSLIHFDLFECWKCNIFVDIVKTALTSHSKSTLSYTSQIFVITNANGNKIQYLAIKECFGILTRSRRNYRRSCQHVFI